jgi:FkbM family methyltransferase
MKQFQGVWFPDHETHLPDWMAKAGEIIDGRGTYQIKKLRTAVGLCKQRRVAVDVGGHVGLWSMQLVKLFDRVHAFEPVAAHQECFVKNVVEHGVGDPILHECALGEREGMISIFTEKGSSGNSHIDINAKGNYNIPMKTLDSLALEEVDFMKLDTEGYEENILRGAIETIKRCRPVIIVEQKRDMAEARFGLRPRGAVTFLESLGYKMVKEMSGDYIMVPA